MIARLLSTVAAAGLVAAMSSPAWAQSSSGAEASPAVPRAKAAKAAKAAKVTAVRGRQQPAARYAQAGSVGRSAAKADDDDDDNKGPGAKKDDDDEGVETESLFGFTDGTDVGEQGETGFDIETVGRFGKRAGTFRALASKAELEYVPFDRFSVAIAAIANRTLVRNVPELDNSSGSGLGGFSMEFKYGLIQRGPSSPIGVTLIAEPSLGLMDESSGRRQTSRGIEAKLAFDAALVPETVFAALNVIYEAEASRPSGLVAYDATGTPLEFGDPGAAFFARLPEERESTFGLSGALAVAVAKDVFLGAEARYFRAYEGLGFQTFAGQALFLGPTLYAKVNDRLAISAAFSSQVAGKEAGERGPLDLENFERHQAKLKLSLGF